MINYDEIYDLSGGFKKPAIQTRSIELPPFKNLKDLYVKSKDKKSLKELRRRLNDMDCYSSIMITKLLSSTDEVLEKHRTVGQFDFSKILCGECSHEDKSKGTRTDYGVLMITRTGAVTPSKLICSNCGIDYLKLLEDLK